MLSVQLRFYEELNDFIRKEYRKKQINRHLKHRTTVKDVIESFGVPHTEVDLILVNGKSESFNYHVKDKDKISVYPVFESFDISSITRLQGRHLRNIRFVADVQLGKLAKKLRFLGLDVEYRNDFTNEKILQRVTHGKRVLLTRDRRLLMHNVVQHGYLLRSDLRDKQTVEVVFRFDLADQLNPFARCAECNSVLHTVPKAQILNHLEPKTKLYYQNFVQCERCRKVYWEGSHFIHLNEFVKWVRDSTRQLTR